jgi:hypothetical protein
MKAPQDFGCRDQRGEFDLARFADKAAAEQVKLIELKLSQGAKPGLGGILPGRKVTKEIAEIRHVPLGLSARRFSIRSAPARWARRRIEWQWSMSVCAYTEFRGCAWSMPR